MDWKKVLNDVNRNVSTTYDASIENVLDRLGLEHRKSTMDVVLPMLGVFGAGIAVGASLGLLFAPKRGNELRNELRHSIEDLRERSTEKFNEVSRKTREGNETALAQETDSSAARS
ncbi:YtxH domain-containing protein [Bradymonadaceae bacterium TMQ3]|uniref:YtxH domain-containing protein n=1 Tax=Lujinxingia sediminis TaxID=2480984 RepID=A0ABY0CPC2_9DELT|nr:YtxH domain-containing protein [Lujinxingia sediminis]RDV38024.1 YtxH domain-containing protein [Bradymonadaceae bacterium TMQ3]RVU42306.1 YtxH domain-containing protein [Lujinxingia sediminis]TXC75695.1 YtxH domain-containing protein [Bradymonadales bacterium TMQ1]